MKDTNNIETYNIWSGTDYNENTTDFTVGSGANMISSKEWSVIGESSLKIERMGDSSFFSDTSRLTDVTVGKTLTYSCVIYSPNIEVNIRLRGKGNNLVSVTVPVSNNPTLVSLSAVVPENYDYMFLRFLPASKGSLFVDNIISTLS